LLTTWDMEISALQVTQLLKRRTLMLSHEEARFCRLGTLDALCALAVEQPS